MVSVCKGSVLHPGHRYLHFLVIDKLWKSTIAHSAVPPSYQRHMVHGTECMTPELFLSADANWLVMWLQSVARGSWKEDAKNDSEARCALANNCDGPETSYTIHHAYICMIYNSETLCFWMDDSEKSVIHVELWDWRTVLYTHVLVADQLWWLRYAVHADELLTVFMLPVWLYKQQHCI